MKLDGKAIERVFSLQLPHPGVYSVVVQAWFANASASLIYVKVRGIGVETPSSPSSGAEPRKGAALR